MLLSIECQHFDDAFLLKM